MSPNRLLFAGAAVAVVAAAAILTPGVASGVLPTLLPAVSVVTPGPDSGGHGTGNAWGHHKDDPAFPGNNGRSNGHGADHDIDNSADHGNGNAWGHHTDDPAFPGNNGRSNGRGHGPKAPGD